MKAIIESESEQVELETIALGINLALDSNCALLMANYNKKKGLKLLMKRAFKFRDFLVMKMVRNVSQHDQLKQMFCVSSTLISPFKNQNKVLKQFNFI